MITWSTRVCREGAAEAFQMQPLRSARANESVLCAGRRCFGRPARRAHGRAATAGAGAGAAASMLAPRDDALLDPHFVARAIGRSLRNGDGAIDTVVEADRHLPHHLLTCLGAGAAAEH